MFQSLPEARKSASSRRESTCVVQCVSRSADKIQFVRSVKLAPRSTADTKCPNIRSEEHTSELQSLMRISYAVFCLKKKTNNTPNNKYYRITYKRSNRQNTNQTRKRRTHSN